MDKMLSDKVEYMIAAISEFAAKHCLSIRQSYRYLKRYKGVEFLERFYNINHTLSFNEVVDDLTDYCKLNGGKIS